MEAYLEAMDRAGKRSANDARSRTGLHILPALGPIEVEKLTRLRLEKWRDALAASPRTSKTSKRPLPERVASELPKAGSVGTPVTDGLPMGAF